MDRVKENVYSPLGFFTGIVVSDVGVLNPNCPHHPWANSDSHSDTQGAGSDPTDTKNTYNVKMRVFFLCLYHLSIIVVLFFWHNSEFVFYFAYIIGWGYFFLLVTSIVFQVGVGIYYRGETGKESTGRVEKTKVVVPTYLPGIETGTGTGTGTGNVSVEDIHAEICEGRMSSVRSLGVETASLEGRERQKSKELRRTIEGLLHTFHGEDVLVVENRSGEVRPSAAFLELCCEKGVSYAYLPIGGKSIAAYYGGKHMTEKKFGESESDWPEEDGQKIIMLMDDDVVLSNYFQMDTREHWSGQCFQLTADYPIEEGEEVPHAPPPMIEAAQDAEFHFAIHFKKMQDVIYDTGVITPHGAISAWKRDVFLRVMEQHDTAFDGEDLQMGLIYHGQTRNESGEEKLIANAQMAAKTEVMSSLTSMCRPKTDTGMKKSLFDQRVKSWYATQFRWSFISKYLVNTMFWHGGCCRKFGIRAWCMFQLLVILRDVLLRFAVIVIALLRWADFLPMLQAFALLFIFETVFVSLTVGWMYFKRTRGKSASMYGKKLPITWFWVIRFVFYFMFYKLLIILYHQMGFWFAVTHPLPSADPIHAIEHERIPRGSPYLTLLTDLSLFEMVCGVKVANGGEGEGASVLRKCWMEVWEKGYISRVKVISTDVLSECVHVIDGGLKVDGATKESTEDGDGGVFDGWFRRMALNARLGRPFMRDRSRVMEEFIRDIGHDKHAFLVVIDGVKRYKGRVVH
jgi:hypothetical protein